MARKPQHVGTIVLLGLGRLLRTRVCSVCGAVLINIARGQHEQWHRAELERIEHAQAAAVAEAVAKAIPATLAHVDVSAWR